MKMNPYLTFDGNCEEAFKAYAKILGGKIEAMMPFEGTPSEEYVPAEWGKKIMHACLTFGDNRLMASDGPSDCSEKMQGISVALHPEEPAEAERLFNSPVRRRRSQDAARRDVLGAKVRHAGRSFRHAVDDQLLQADVTERAPPLLATAGANEAA
jgi:PhnB protein